MQSDKVVRITAVIFCLFGLLIVFVFQNIDVAGILFHVDGKSSKFLINRTLRFLINDGLAIGLIFGLFGERKYLVFSLWVQVTGMTLILLPYLILKLYYPSYNGPLISFLHRLIINPTLLLLLIPAFYYQKGVGGKQT